MKIGVKKISRRDIDGLYREWSNGARTSDLAKKHHVTRSTINRTIKEYVLEKNLPSRVRPPLPCRNNIVGQTFGRLLVISMWHSGVKRTSWEAVCKCEACGREDFRCPPRQLRQRINPTCGCTTWSRKRGENSPFFTGHKQISGSFWSRFQKRARLSGIPFELSIKQAWRLFLNQQGCCALSGIKIFFGKSNYEETTASLDRIDSRKGYVRGNVQWVHKDINKMKLNHSDKEFIQLCSMVANHATKPSIKP